MKKHQFVKADCNCPHRDTYFVCKYCGAIEYGAADEIRALPAYQALCTSSAAPLVSALESIKSKASGTFDCLSPDFEVWKDGSE